VGQRQILENTPSIKIHNQDANFRVISNQSNVIDFIEKELRWGYRWW
jgi:hypothetical protein